MRDGQWIATRVSKELNTDEIIRLMVNRDMENRFPPKHNAPGEVLLEARNITGKYEPACKDVSFELRAGEVLGVAGLVGSRRTELLSTLFGVNTRECGTLTLRGQKIDHRDASTATRQGFAYLTEERRSTGLFPHMSVTFNSVIANVKSYGKLLLSAQDGTRRRLGNRFDPGQDAEQAQQSKSLSGCNQQKVIIGRWLLTSPDILLSTSDAAHRRRRQVRNLPADPEAGRGGQGGYDGVERDAGARGHLRPDPGHVGRPARRHPHARPGLRRHPGRAGDDHAAGRTIRLGRG